jgi:hypothetical protein
VVKSGTLGASTDPWGVSHGPTNDFQKIEAEYKTTEMSCLWRHGTGRSFKPQTAIWCEEDHETDVHEVQRDRTLGHEISVTLSMLVEAKLAHSKQQTSQQQLSLEVLTLVRLLPKRTSTALRR